MRSYMRTAPTHTHTHTMPTCANVVHAHIHTHTHAQANSSTVMSSSLSCYLYTLLSSPSRYSPLYLSSAVNELTWQCSSSALSAVSLSLNYLKAGTPTSACLPLTPPHTLPLILSPSPSPCLLSSVPSSLAVILSFGGRNYFLWLCRIWVTHSAMKRRSEGHRLVNSENYYGNITFTVWGLILVVTIFLFYSIIEVNIAACHIAVLLMTFYLSDFVHNVQLIQFYSKIYSKKLSKLK